MKLLQLQLKASSLNNLSLLDVAGEQTSSTGKGELPAKRRACR